MLNKLCLLTLICLICFSSEIAFAQKKTPASKTKKTTVVDGDSDSMKIAAPIDYIPPKANPAQKRRFETFDKVWNTINEHYFDPTFNGLNWKAMRTEYRTKIPKLKSDFELHRIIQEMISRFNRSHFYIVLPEAFEEIEYAKAESKRKELARRKADKNLEPQADEISEKEPDEKNENESFYQYSLLVDLRIIDSQVVITQVAKDSNAERAGLRTGFVLDKINGVSLKELIARIETYNFGSAQLKRQMPKILLTFLEGEEDSEVEITYLNEKNQPHTVSVKRQGIPGELVLLRKNLPEQLVFFERKSLDEETGYIRFNFFAFPILNKFCQALTEFKDKKSLIIDLRGNMGGAISVLWGLTGLLIDKQMLLGNEIKRDGKVPHLIRPMPKNFKGKIVVLVDGQSVSASEIFAAGLQENNRATIIGERTAGEALPSLSISLPTGGAFIYPFANFQSPTGVILEGKGVMPNISIPWERTTLLEGRDVQLENALNYLKKTGVAQSPSQAVGKDDIDESPTPIKITPPKPTPPIIQAVPSVINENPAAVQLKPPRENKQDTKALEIIDEFIKALGGEVALKKVSSYSAFGTVELQRGGAIVEGPLQIYRKAPNKVAEVMYFDGAGEIREVFDGDGYFVQSLFTGIVTQDPTENEYKTFADFYEFLKFKELYPTITYQGSMIDKGRKTEIIKTLNQNGDISIFVFDAETKYLISRGGIITNYTFDKYRKFGNLMFPTVQTRQGIFTFKIDEVKFDTNIPDSKFVKEDNCFTKID